MNNILPPFFKKIDTWLLLNYPRVWASRVHNFLYILLLIFVVGFLLGFLMSTSFDGTTNYITDTITLYFTIGLVILTGAVIWLTRFRAKIAPLNYKENLILTVSFTLLSILMFVAAWSVNEGHRQRIVKSYDKTDIENDFLIATISDKTHDFRHLIDSIEDIKIGDYVIKAAETRLIKQNLDYFDAMRNTIDSSEVLNNLSMPEINNNDDYTTRRIEWLKSRNNRILESKLTAIRALKTIPDSMVQIYNQLLIKQLSSYNINKPLSEYGNFDSKVSDEDFETYQLYKITPSRAYLMQKYKCVSFSTVYTNLKTMYALQRQSFMQRLTFSNANYWDYIDPVTTQYESNSQYYRGYGGVNENNVQMTPKVQMRQSYAENTRKTFRLAQYKEFYPLLNQVIWFILLLTIPLLSIVVFGLRHTLFSFLGFIVVMSLLAITNKLRFCEIHTLGYCALIIITATTFFLGFNKNATHKSWGELFIPFSIFAMFYFVNICYQVYIYGTTYNEINKSQYYHLSLESILMNYGIFVLPLLFMIYNRLAFLPKSK